MSLQTASRAATVLVLVVIVFATLAPLQFRPTVGAGGGANLERFAAYLALGGCFALGFPRKALGGGVFIAVLAIVLELAQSVAIERHGELSDMLVKIAGGMAGIAIGYGVSRWLAASARSSKSAGHD